MTPMTTAAADRSVRHLDLALRLHRAAGAACLSPLSVVSALGTAATGAAGTTRAELVALLGEPDELRADLVAAAIAKPGEDVELALANTVWAREDVTVRDAYRADIIGWGQVRPAPFTDPERARALINADIAQTTRDRIPALIPPGALHPATLLALVNALYLRTGWHHPFPAQATADRPFRGAGAVATMRITATFGYAAADGWQAVRLPAAGGVEAVLLVPDGDLPDDPGAGATVSARQVTALLAATEYRHLDLSVPRFEVRARCELTDALRGLGVATLFTPAADFTPLATTPLLVDQVLHEAVLRVDEQGFEGAAATAMLFPAGAAFAPPEPLPVRVDRPFLVLVRHTATGAVYFLTRVTGAAVHPMAAASTEGNP